MMQISKDLLYNVALCGSLQVVLSWKSHVVIFHPIN